MLLRAAPLKSCEAEAVACMANEPLLRRVARRVLGDEEASKLWKRVELIGDLVVIRKPFDYPVDKLKPLAEALLREVPHARSVWAAVSPVRGSYRIREFVHLAGEPRSETVYREHGCSFKLDITKVYVSPSLNYEHGRVARLVREGEVVVNMFAGAGLYSIVIAKKAKPKKVYSIDVNPDAYKYMVENVRLNRVEGVVEPILGDAAKVIEERLRGVADRVLMPCPELALRYLDKAVLALKPGGRGFVHVFTHVEARHGEDPVRKSEGLVSEALSATPGVEGFEVGFSRVVRTVGPRRYQVVHDVVVLTAERRG